MAEGKKIFFHPQSSVVTLKCYCDQNFTFPFTFTKQKYTAVGRKYYPCQILNCNSNGKLDYFKHNLHIWFAAITQFRHAHKPHGELGQVECDVMLSHHFTKKHPHTAVVFKTT